MKILLFIPARGGSETIPLKNLHPLGDHPLIHWVLSTCRLFKLQYDVIVSTDHPEIREYAQMQGFNVDERPPSLADGAISEAVIEYCGRQNHQYDIIILVQPTSPFVISEDIHSVIAALKNSDYPSAQTICKVPHNYHAWNQRTFSHERCVGWYASKQRTLTNRKQGKPKLYKFGNCVAVRGDPTILQRHGFFALPSRGIVIPWKRALDLDSLDDFELAEALIETGRI